MCYYHPYLLFLSYWSDKVFVYHFILLFDFGLQNELTSYPSK